MRPVHLARKPGTPQLTDAIKKIRQERRFQLTEEQVRHIAEEAKIRGIFPHQEQELRVVITNAMKPKQYPEITLQNKPHSEQLKPIKPEELEKVLHTLGFERISHGSNPHKMVRDSKGRTAELPIHKEDVKITLLTRLLKIAGISDSEFNKARHGKKH